MDEDKECVAGALSFGIDGTAQFFFFVSRALHGAVFSDRFFDFAHEPLLTPL
jgi:hypothetical protein